MIIKHSRHPLGHLADFVVREYKLMHLLQIYWHFNKSASFWVISFPYLHLRVRLTKESFWNAIVSAIKLHWHFSGTPHRFCSTRGHFSAPTARSCSLFEIRALFSYLSPIIRTSNSTNQRKIVQCNLNACHTVVTFIANNSCII